MKQKPRWTLEMLIAALAVLCALLTLALLVQRPAGWPALAVLVVLWGIGICVFRYQLRRWTAKWVAGGSFENSRTQYSLESLSQPAALLSGETVLWYNSRFRTALLGGEDRLAGRAQKLLPGLDTAQARTPEGQQLNLADGVWNVHSSTVPGGSESMTLLVFNEETALRRIETEYKGGRVSICLSRMISQALRRLVLPLMPGISRKSTSRILGLTSVHIRGGVTPNFLSTNSVSWFMRPARRGSQTRELVLFLSSA